MGILTDIWEWLTEVWTSVSLFITETLPSFFADALQWIGNFFSDLWNSFVDLTLYYLDLLLALVYGLTVVPLTWLAGQLAELTGLSQLTSELGPNGTLSFVVSAYGFFGNFIDFGVCFAALVASLVTIGTLAIAKFLIKLIPTVG